MDERVSIKELEVYVEKHHLPFQSDVVKDMFKEASKGRGVAHKERLNDPLTIDEI